jgi:hypothetical protein
MKTILHITGHLLAAITAIALFGAAFMFLWNALLPQIFGITAINYWQSLGLLTLLAGLSKFMIIAAFLGMRGYRHNPIHEKWMKMSDEERKTFIKNRRSGHNHSFGHFGHDFFDREKPEKKD